MMNRKKYFKYGKLVFIPCLLLTIYIFSAQQVLAQERLPVREYTNPDEVVTFDRSVTFERALDVINEFAQENLGKIVIDRTGTEGEVGISIPPMHWQDALDLILRVKGLHLVEQKDFFEIVFPPTPGGQPQTQAAGPQPQQQAEDVIATTRTREVRINAIFFEGNRRALREIGIDWSTLSEGVPENLTDYVGAGTSGDQLPGTVGFDNQFVSVNSRGAQSVSQSVFNALINSGEIANSGIQVQALFSAFEADNLGEILASPSIKVMNRQEGQIQVGQDFSIKQRDFAGNVTDNFVSVGTILTVTPTVITQNDTTFIHVNVQAERSSAQPDPVSTIVNKQAANTQAILMNGEATAIAGLYRTETAEVRRGLPILKDLPPWFFGLRYLFGFNSNDQQMRELVILVQAELEPSIPARFGKKQLSKFDVLNDARQRIRTEIEKKEDQTLDAGRGEEMQSQEEGATAVEAAAEAEDREEVIAEDEETEEAAPAKRRSDRRKRDREEEEPDVDSELDIKPVPLDLGAEEEQEEPGDTAAVTRMDTEEDEPQDTAEEPAEQEETEETTETAGQQEMEKSDTGTSGSRYYIIGASFNQRKNAEQYQKKLLDEGFEALILTNEASGFHYVAYRGYKELDSAQKGLADIKQYYNSEAWLYKSRN